MKVEFLDRKDFVLDVCCNKRDNFYEVTAIGNNNEKFAKMNFSFHKNDYGNRSNTWLWFIETKDEYQKQGFATKMLDFLEYISSTNHMPYIEGKYYPLNKEANSFYINNGYEIYKDGYETFIYKSVDNKKISEKVKPNILISEDIIKKDFEEEYYQ